MTWRRLLSAGLMVLIADLAAAAERVTRLGPPNATAELVIWGATDLDELRPALDGFLALHPSVAITYHDLQSADLYDHIRTGQPAPPDLTISSAADLQIKLVNDGFALEHTPAKGVSLPSWATWRNQAFGISIEPAVMVFHKSLSQFGPLPQSRTDLAELIANNLAALDGRVATYDLELSGLGYLFASQDALYSTTYTTLLQSLGRAHARLHCCSSEILDAVEKQTALVGYNVLGSYALARKQSGAPIEIVLPEDYVLVLSRVALIPRGAKRADLAGAFLDFLLSPENRKRFADLERYGSPPTAILHPIVLNPSLLVGLDPLKRTRFIKAWRTLIAPGAR